MVAAAVLGTLAVTFLTAVRLANNVLFGINICK